MKARNKKIFEKYLNNISTAYSANYSLNMPSFALNELLGAFNEEINSDYNFNSSCSSCVLKFLKLCGKLYFEGKL